MAGPTGVPPVGAVQLTLPRAEAAAFRPGQTFPSTVQGNSQGLWVSVGGSRVPLDSASGLLPGQNVTVSVATNGSGIQLQVQPAPTGATAAAAELPQAFAEAIRTFGATNLAEAAKLAPASLAQKPAALQNLLSLFTGPSSTGKDLEMLAGLVAQAVESGALPSALAGEFTWLVGQLVAKDADNLEQVLRRLGRNAGKSLEARLAAALRSGNVGDLADAIQGDLRGQLSRLLQDARLTEFLRGHGQLDAFRNAANDVMQRLDNQDLQNLRALDAPYVFVEVPFPADSPFNHARLHIWGREGDARRRFDRDNAEAVLDLSTTALGDLWIGVSIASGHCACHFRATSAESVEAIRASGDELVTALRDAGYRDALVRVAPWDGDRLRETADLMRRMAGVDLKA